MSLHPSLLSHGLYRWRGQRKVLEPRPATCGVKKNRCHGRCSGYDGLRRGPSRDLALGTPAAWTTSTKTRLLRDCSEARICARHASLDRGSVSSVAGHAGWCSSNVGGLERGDLVVRLMVRSKFLTLCNCLTNNLRLNVSSRLHEPNWTLSVHPISTYRTISIVRRHSRNVDL